MKLFRNLLVFIPALTGALGRETKRIKDADEDISVFMDPNGRFKKIEALIYEILEYPKSVDIEDIGRANQAYADTTMPDAKYEEFTRRILELL
jgi:hypothetical protein